MPSDLPVPPDTQETNFAGRVERGTRGPADERAIDEAREAAKRAAESAPAREEHDWLVERIVQMLNVEEFGIKHSDGGERMRREVAREILIAAGQERDKVLRVRDEAIEAYGAICRRVLPYRPPMSSKLGPGPAIDNLIEHYETAAASRDREGRLEEALLHQMRAGGWLVRCLKDVIAGKPVRGLDEAATEWDTATAIVADLVALAPSKTPEGSDA
jgi:hypothetical protein